jgi:hypothetical protein
MTLDELRNLPPPTDEEIQNALNFKNTDFSDCPIQTEEELSKFKPWYALHQNHGKEKISAEKNESEFFLEQK